MKKFLLSLFLLLSLAVTAAAAGTDVLTNKSLNNGKDTNSSGYTTVNSTGFDSGAEYIANANFLLNKGYYYYDLNTSNYIATKVSGGRAVSVKITSTTQKVTTSTGRVVTVYGSHEQFTNKANGTEIGSWKKVANQNIATIDLTDKTYEYIVICVTGGAFHFEQIDIEWVAADKQDVTITNELITQTYNPNSPKVDLSQNLPADLLKDATLKFSGAVDLNEDGSVAKTYIASDGTIKAANVTEKEVTVAWSGSASYKDSFHKFKFLIGKATPSVKYKNGEAEVTAFTATIGEKNDFPVAIVEPAGLTLRYSSSSRAIADIDDNTGAITLKKDGNATIGAFFDGDALFNDASATYTLTVNPEKDLEAPTFNLTDGETYPYGTELEINSTAADAKIEYSLDLENFITYTGEPIVLNKAGKWEVYVVVTRGEQTVDATITLNVEKLTYNYTFQEKTYELGTNRYFEAPKLVDADGNVVEGVVYSIVPGENTTLEEVPGSKTEQYFIVGTGDVMVEATIAESDSHKEFSDMTTVTVKEQTAGGNSELDFTDNKNFDELKDKEFESGKGITLTDLKIAKSNITILFKNISNASLEPRMWSNAKDGIDLRLYVGHSFTLSTPENSTIESIEFIFDSGNANANSFDATSDGINTIGELSTQQNATDARTWTPAGVKTNEVVFVFKNTTRINYINVKYTAEPATTYNLKFDEEIYGFEVGDKLPAVNVPEGYTATYVFNGKKVDNPETFVFTEDLENAELYAYAFTGKDDKYLPAVAYAIADVKPIILPGHLTIHYSNADGFSMASFATVDEGSENEYVFNDIEVTGYDSADGHYYGHVFFSFYKPAEAAGAPRRAVEDDWSAVNNLVTYTPAEHLTMAQPGSSDALTLVRNKANTFTGMPNSFRVPSSHETGNAVNFTVKLTENGTPATMTVASGIQTGVESVGVDADGEAEFYTLQGVRVAKPAAGIYLRRQGGTVSKVLVK